MSRARELKLRYELVCLNVQFQEEALQTKSYYNIQGSWNLGTVLLLSQTNPGMFRAEEAKGRSERARGAQGVNYFSLSRG